MYKFGNFSWSHRPVTLPNGRETTLEILFIGAIEKEDYQEILSKVDNEYERQELIQLRLDAGEELTRLGITPRNATTTLINIWEMAYLDGNREEWAVYAHNKLNQKTGCLKYIIIAIVLFVLYKLLS